VEVYGGVEGPGLITGLGMEERQCRALIGEARFAPTAPAVAGTRADDADRSSAIRDSNPQRARTML
jgi:hypothetical protein